jgi:F-type H+-transporting ATPase subunit b
MSHAEATNNFLIPNGTFFFEVICFLVVLWILGRYILPRISGAIEKRQESIRQQFEDAQRAREEAEANRKEYQQALAETRREIARIREEVAAERGQILDQARQEAAAYREEQLRVLDQRLEAERYQILLSLRDEVGQLAYDLAEKIVHESLRDDDRQRRLVEDFIEGIGSTVTAEAGASSS